MDNWIVARLVKNCLLTITKSKISRSTYKEFEASCLKVIKELEDKPDERIEENGCSQT